MITGKRSHSAIVGAAQGDYEPIVEVLLLHTHDYPTSEVHGDASSPIQEALTLAATNGHEGTVRLLLLRTAARTMKRHFYDPLLGAAKNGHVGIAKTPIDHKQDIAAIRDGL